MVYPRGWREYGVPEGMEGIWCTLEDGGNMVYPRGWREYGVP